MGKVESFRMPNRVPIFNRPVTLGELCVFGAAIRDMAGLEPPSKFFCWRLVDTNNKSEIACVDPTKGPKGVQD